MKPKYSCEKGKAMEFEASTANPKNRLTPKRAWLAAIKLIERSMQSVDIDFQTGKRQAVICGSGGTASATRRKSLLGFGCKTPSTVAVLQDRRLRLTECDRCLSPRLNGCVPGISRATPVEWRCSSGKPEEDIRSIQARSLQS